MQRFALLEAPPAPPLKAMQEYSEEVLAKDLRAQVVYAVE
jgi:hypothetical protein